MTNYPKYEIWTQFVDAEDSLPVFAEDFETYEEAFKAREEYIKDRNIVAYIKDKETQEYISMAAGPQNMSIYLYCPKNP